MRARLTILLVLGLAAVVAAQSPPDATPAHRLAWDQSGTDAATYTYEVQFDAQPFGPALSVTCAGTNPQTCAATFPQSLTEGLHVARVRSARVVNGIRQVSPPSADFQFDYFPNSPPPPTNPRLTLPEGAVGVLMNGVVQNFPVRFPRRDDSALVTLDNGSDYYLDYERIAMPGGLRSGDKFSMIVYR